jgi:hypothetical protein
LENKLVNKEIKEMKDKEILKLQNIIDKRTSIMLDISFYAIIIILVYAMTFEFYKTTLNTVQFNRNAIFTAILIAIIIKIAFSVKNIKLILFKNKYDLSIKKEIEDRVVTEYEYCFTEVIKVVEFEDEGVGYYFKISEDKTLFLQSQEFYYYKVKNEFPGSKIITRRTLNSNILLDFKLTGDSVPISLERTSFSDDEINTLSEFESDEVILDISFEKLKENIIKKGLNVFIEE